jgi:DNA-binding IclR family transcriptional regulator
VVTSLSELATIELADQTRKAYCTILDFNELRFIMPKSAAKLGKLDSAQSGGGVQSVEVGMRVLRSLTDLGGEESLSKISDHVGMPSAKVHRYLASLVRSGFVERSSNSNRYVLGGMALRAGLVALSRVDVVELAYKELDELRDSIEASLLLAVWGTNGPTIVRWVESARPVTVNIRVGSNMPLLRSATGQIFAAWLPQSTIAPAMKAELSEMKKQQGTVLSMDEVEARLEKVRKAGLGHTAGGVLPGVLALAAPVCDHNDSLVAVITALGPAGHFDDSPNGKTARALLASSRRLSERLGSAAFSMIRKDK